MSSSVDHGIKWNSFKSGSKSDAQSTTDHVQASGSETGRWDVWHESPRGISAVIPAPPHGLDDLADEAVLSRPYTPRTYKSTAQDDWSDHTGRRADPWNAGGKDAAEVAAEVFKAGPSDIGEILTNKDRKAFKTGAVRDSRGKTRFDLVPPEHTQAIAEILTMGAEKKYAPRNWEKGIPYSELYASAARHINSFLKGEYYDKESGLLHVSHACWNLMAIEVMIIRGRSAELDDLTAARRPT